MRTPTHTDLSPKPTKADIAQNLLELKRRIERGDPVAIYEAILMCSGTKISLPPWLSEHPLKVIAEFHLGKKPSWKNIGNRPLIIVRRRIENDVKRRAVVSIRNWQKDRSKYNEMPSRCIDAWFDGHEKHCQNKTLEHALDFARLGLRGERIQKGGPTIKCSPTTLKRVYYNKEYARMPRLTGEIATVFGLKNPDDLFGTSKILPRNLE